MSILKFNIPSLNFARTATNIDLSQIFIYLLNMNKTLKCGRSRTVCPRRPPLKNTVNNARKLRSIDEGRRGRGRCAPLPLLSDHSTHPCIDCKLSITWSVNRIDWWVEREGEGLKNQPWLYQRSLSKLTDIFSLCDHSLYLSMPWGDVPHYGVLSTAYSPLCANYTHC